MMSIMLHNVELQERRRTPATGKAAQPMLDGDSHDDADYQARFEDFPKDDDKSCKHWCLTQSLC